jgi:hypothetical protein
MNRIIIILKKYNFYFLVAAALGVLLNSQLSPILFIYTSMVSMYKEKEIKVSLVFLIMNIFIILKMVMNFN